MKTEDSELLNSKVTLILGDNEKVDVDTLCACEAYSEFLRHRGIEAKHTLNVELSNLQSTVLEMCGIDKPKNLEATLGGIQAKDASKLECEFIILKPNSLKTLHSEITPSNIVGMISTFKPEYIQHLSEEDFKNFNSLQFEVVGSVSTLISEKFKLTNTPINSNIASLLMIGIILNTNGLEESQTYDRDFVAIEFLEEFANIRKDQINALVNQL